MEEITVTDKNVNPIRNLFYEYDNEERITKVVDSVDGTTEYTYDSLGQLLTEKRNGIDINSMTYDSNCNRIVKKKSSLFGTSNNNSVYIRISSKYDKSISPKKWDNFKEEFKQVGTLIESFFDPE